MEISTAGHKTIWVPVPSEADSQQIIKQGSTFRSFVAAHIDRYPQLFPAEISTGYWLHTLLLGCIHIDQ